MKTPKKERNLKKIGDRWYFDFSVQQPDGKLKRYVRLAGKAKDEARDALARFRVELGSAPKEEPAEVEDPLFDAFAKEYLELYSKPNKRSWERDERTIKILGAAFGARRLSEISLMQVERYRVDRLAQVSFSTVNRELACLKGILSKALDWDKLESFPLRKIRIDLKSEPKRERVLTPDEEVRLLRESSPYLRAMIVLALNTGMRQGEILKIRTEHVNMEGRVLKVPLENSKSKRPRMIPLNSAALELLRPLVESPGFVFIKSRGRGYKTIRSGFNAARDRAEIKDLRFHDLRHTFETRSIESGANPANIVRIMGHASIPFSLEHYFHASPDALLRDVEGLAKMPSKSKVYSKESLVH